VNKILFILLLLAFISYGQQKRVAIINTVDDEEPPLKISDLNYLTDRLREIATEILHQKNYDVMTVQSMVAFLGSQEEMVKKCRASEGCLAKLGREINADYVGQGRIGRFGGDLSIKVELYASGKGNLMSSFTGFSKDIYGLLSIINEKAPVMFRKLPGVSDTKPYLPPVDDAVSKVQIGAVLTDSRDGKKYKTVKIGEQTWMAENLNYDARDSKCYGNGSVSCEKYGRLYNWEAANKACPSGWHLPSSAEWDVLMIAVGGSMSAATKLKAKSGWHYNGNGTDEFGFSALPGGDGNHPDGDFLNVGLYGSWWTASELSDGLAYYRFMFYYYGEAYWTGNYKSKLLSVRCVKD